MAAVPAGAYHLGVGLVYGGLLGKLGLELAQHAVEGTVEQPAYQAEGKHVAALEDALHVHAGVGKGVLDQRGHLHEHDAARVDAKLLDRVVGGKLRLFQVGLLELVNVADDDTA